MKEIDRFQIIRNQKIKFSLKTRMTLYVGIIVLGSIVAAYGFTKLMDWVSTFSANIPLVVQLIVFSLLVAMLAARLISNMFFNPITELRKGMQKIADGEFETRLQTKSSFAEMQELFAGFNMMAKELGSMEILQTDFVSNVSHEFKTPINAIEGYTTLLQSTDNIDEVESEYIDKILYNTKRLSSLVSNILLLSKLENQSIETNKEWYDLDEQIREEIVAMESAWGPKNLEFDVDLDDVNYYGNENMLHHVWGNLLSNAIKFSPDNGMIRISLKNYDDKLVFIIEDQGPGLSEEGKRHLFDKFYQEDTSHKEEGNGLGLALVKKILNLVDGDILAENKYEGGCRVSVALKNRNENE